jgi:small subunit ribosomal protein S17
MTTRGLAKQEIGIVLQRKQDKTAVVSLEKFQTHELYKKRIRRTKKVYAHDEKNSALAGDTVLITETRPLSKTKRWRIVKILERSKVGQEKLDIAE